MSGLSGVFRGRRELAVALNELLYIKIDSSILQIKQKRDRSIIKNVYVHLLIGTIYQKARLWVKLPHKELINFAKDQISLWFPHETRNGSQCALFCSEFAQGYRNYASCCSDAKQTETRCCFRAVLSTNIAFSSLAVSVLRCFLVPQHTNHQSAHRKHDE